MFQNRRITSPENVPMHVFRKASIVFFFTNTAQPVHGVKMTSYKGRYDVINSINVNTTPT